MTMTESGTEAKSWSGPVPDPSVTESGLGQDWVSVTDAAALAGVQERSIRRWIARGVVVSRIDDSGRRLVLTGSLPGPGPRPDPVTDPGPGPVTDQLAREHAMVEFLQGQLQQARDSERELRLLLAQATRTAQLALERPALPAAAAPSRVRWWKLWRRG